ncbi:MAG: diacylglycerol kinase family protein [Wenzhouxiangella sp.]
MALAAAQTGDRTHAAEQATPARRFILANPHSFRMASRNRLQRINRLAQAHKLPLYTVHGPEQIAAALADIKPGPADQLIIIGGDGTLQAAVSELAEPAAAGRAPGLVVLGGGRTNFTARDLGSHDRLLGSLEHLIQQPEDWRPMPRTVLKISGSPNGDLYGFFVAGALVDSVIRDCHEHRSRSKTRLGTGLLATPLRLSQLALLALIGRARFQLPTIKLEAGALGTVEGKTRILLLTSLHHVSGALNPYAARGTGPVRVTAILDHAPGFWRRLPGLLRGKLSAKATPRQGYLSGSTDALRLSGLPSICLDGQEFSLNPAAPLTVEAGPVFRFLHP